MRSKRELQKQIQKHAEAIDCYKEAMKRLIADRDNPAVTNVQLTMNEHLIRDCNQYIKQYERNIQMLEHEMLQPPKESVQVYDHVWEQVLSGEPVKAGRLV